MHISHTIGFITFKIAQTSYPIYPFKLFRFTYNVQDILLQYIILLYYIRLVLLFTKFDVNILSFLTICTFLAYTHAYYTIKFRPKQEDRIG